MNMEAYSRPCESYNFIEGKVIKPAAVDATKGVSDFKFTNNGLAFLFSEMRYELNGTEIQKLKSPGISSTLKGYCSHTPNDLYELENAAWYLNMNGVENKDFVVNEVFSGCILNFVKIINNFT